MSDISLGGGSKEKVPETKKMIYLNIPTAILMILELGDSKNIKKYADPIIDSIKKSLTNKELSRVICGMFGVKSARKFKKLKPNEFTVMSNIFGNIWGL